MECTLRRVQVSLISKHLSMQVLIGCISVVVGCESRRLDNAADAADASSLLPAPECCAHHAAEMGENR